MPSPSPAPAATGKPGTTSASPLVSVLIPEALDDVRGSAEFVRSWCHQTAEDGAHEVIVVMKEGNPVLAGAVQEFLREQDRLLVGLYETSIACYNAGLTIASGRYVLLTENHTKAAPNCIEELLSYLEQSGNQAASLRSEFRNFNYLDRHEENLYRDYHSEKWSREGEWDRVRLRGFAMERSIFDEIGGLAEDYGLFAEEFLSAELAKRGVGVGYADKASLAHVNVGSFSILRHDITDFVDGECAFRNRDITAEDIAYFGEPDAWRDRAIHSPGFRRRLARSCRKVLRSVLHLGTDKEEKLARFLLPRSASLTIAGFIPEKFHPAWREIPIQWHRFLAWVFKDSLELGLRSFERMWAAVRRKREQEFLVQHPEPEDYRLPSEFIFEDAGPPQLYGFQPLEVYGERTLRWTGPIAAIRLDLPPGDIEVAIDTGLIRGRLEDIPFGIAFNEHVIGGRSLFSGSSSRTPRCSRNGRIRFPVRKEWFVEGEQMLVLCVAPLPSKAAESRELGLPVLDIRFQKLAGSAPEKNRASIPEAREMSETIAG